MSDDVIAPARRERDTDHEVAVKAADAAVWLALVQAERAGWTDVAARLLELKDVTGTRRREVEGANG